MRQGATRLPVAGPSCGGQADSHDWENLSSADRAHGIGVIATGLAARLRGSSHRGIAVDLDVVADTVRGWCCRVSARAEQLRSGAMDHLVALNPDAARIDPAASPLGDALNTLAAAVVAARGRFGLGARPLWPLIGLLGLGPHLAPARSG